MTTNESTEARVRQLISELDQSAQQCGYSSSWLYKVLAAREILAEPPEIQKAVAIQLVNSFFRFHAQLPDSAAHEVGTFANALAIRILKKDVGWNEADWLRMVSAFFAGNLKGCHLLSFQSEIIAQLGQFARQQALGEPVRDTLELLLKELKQAEPPDEYFYQHYAKLETAIAKLIPPSPSDEPGDFIEAGEAWSDAALADLKQMPAEPTRRWLELLQLCLKAEPAKPTQKWAKLASERVAKIGSADFKRRITAWFPLVALPRTAHRTLTYSESMPDPDLLLVNGNATLLKGLAWCCAGNADVEIIRAVSELAEICFKKVRWLGPRCPRVGNACLYSLSHTASEAAAAELTKLDQVVKQTTAKKRIGKSLDQAAETTGQSRIDLEEKSVPTFGLVDGKLTRELGRHTVELELVAAREVEMHWWETDGKALKSVPADVKRDFAPDLKQVQKLAKDIAKMLAAQRIRLERLLLSGREWHLDTWRQRYLDQPLLAGLTRRLIWHFQLGDRTALGAWLQGKLVDVEGKPLDWLAPETRVRLWHPIGFPIATVAAWREWLPTHEVCQPFKQAHREIYVLTDAETATATYSNRFAAHILGQHQFAALCTQRGWKYAYMGGFDSHNVPTLELPQWNMAAEFWVQPAGDELAPSGVALHLATDQVRFVRDGEALPLLEVPATVFTEVMRDVDLFVGVGSIGNDPNWRDQGAATGATAYWHSHAFGELNASALTRKEVLERLLPKLKIAGQCSFVDKFLVVRGSLRTYKIHLGSSNIQMEPNHQYLCIVPHLGAGDRIFLPFEGDRILSVILSKAFLLAADHLIKDPSILHQIRS